MRVGLAGFFKLVAVNAETGEERLLADWFPNLILDSGLEMLGTTTVTNACACCQVGTSSTAPNTAQTALLSRIAGTGSVQETQNGGEGSPDYYGWSRRRYRFGEGVAAGNLSEVAVAPATTGSTFNRALILNNMGVPATITVLSNEFLDVWYELRAYPPLDDTTSSANISGQAHDLTIRAAQAGSDTWAPFYAATTSMFPYSGAIGAITGLPSGTAGTNITPTIAPYSSNSKTLEMTGTWGLNSGNLSGGIRSVATARSSSLPVRFQCEFDPPIDKDNTKLLTLTFAITWARRTL